MNHLTSEIPHNQNQAPLRESGSVKPKRKEKIMPTLVYDTQEENAPKRTTPLRGLKAEERKMY